MKAIFVGQNGSMGFKKGKEYQIFTYVGNGFIWVKAGHLACPYRNLESILENWEIQTYWNPDF